jgi:hypothetical protein
MENVCVNINKHAKTNQLVKDLKFEIVTVKHSCILSSKKFLVYIFLAARVCWPLLCLRRPLCIYERCLESKTESCCRKLANYQLSHLANLATHLPT